MAWRVPCDLQSCAAHAVVIPLVNGIELKIRCHLASVPAELLIARATAELLLRENENEDYDDEDEETLYPHTPTSDDDDEDAPKASTSGSENPTQMDAMDHVMLHVKVSCLLLQHISKQNFLKPIHRFYLTGLV